MATKKKKNVFHVSNVKLASDFKRKQLNAMSKGKDFMTFDEYKKQERAKANKKKKKK